MIYYHNPRCSKSREGLKLLESSKKQFKVKLYLSEELLYSEIEDLLDKLQIDPKELIRKKEKIIEEKGIDLKNMTKKEIILTILKYPILIERPILVSKDKAVIGRPPEIINSILK
tara:strand:- start:712 stop:1056 length:345 start_codon:yes stop_codon:yes gene_type:complete